MPYLESVYYADPHFLLMVETVETEHGECLPIEVGYAYQIGRGKNQTIKCSLHDRDDTRQLLFEARELELWAYANANNQSKTKNAIKARPDYQTDPDFLLTANAFNPNVGDHGGEYVPVEVGRGYKLGRGQSKFIKIGLESGVKEKELVLGSPALELRPFRRIIPESLGKPTPDHQPNYRLAAALNR